MIYLIKIMAEIKLLLEEMLKEMRDERKRSASANGTVPATAPRKKRAAPKRVAKPKPKP